MQRPGMSSSSGKRGTMRPPPPPPGRPASSRNLAAAHPSNGRVSPADSTSSATSKVRSPPQNGGLKRKEREFEQEIGEETNINVVVRCRGRNDREVKENSGIVVSTEGVKGTAVQLSMGPNAMGNKRYHFDKVFSPAADQGIVFDEVVAPILDEVLEGFNCTIFAYGQTGTGKTYTMSGDISDILPVPDEAGIIPRVLHALFTKLEADDYENSVKCSFIELYNEELRDLLSIDENAKLKIYDDAKRKSVISTMVQGMEESHIKSASKGIQLLREGSYKRQVAATKCNDLSSRSHTVFTITVLMKRIGENGEELVTSGKLNLVDLAGSENIQRSGAENKRAAEAGVINKSLLTLGRVINALVDKGSHIPYRESKLTRLLQDSLGGRTKTCIIATLSPARSNLEETISTLDYAFRAKNIRNKPQMNSTIPKKTLIREFTEEIEKLKSELCATRLRNGVYLSAETYEELTIESESRRILSEEQRDKIETMETNLRNKAQELFSLTTNFTNLKKDNETVKQALDEAKNVIQHTEIVLAHTKQTLAEEFMLRTAHENMEDDLANIGNDLISTLDKTTTDIGGLHSKIRRKSELQALNKSHWMSSQDQVSSTTNLVQQRMTIFEAQHQQLISQLSARMSSFVATELSNLENSKSFLADKIKTFEQAEVEVNEQTAKARDDMNGVLEEIKAVKDDVKRKVGEGLDGLSAAAQRISAGVLLELENFHTQLHSSYSSLGKDFKNTFDELVKQLSHQREEADELRQQLDEAGLALANANIAASERLDLVLTEEKEKASNDRKSLIDQMASLINSHGEAQEKRLDQKIKSVHEEIKASNASYQQKRADYSKSMDAWSVTEQSIVDSILKSRESVKIKIKKDWTTASEHNSAIQATTHSVHEETVRIVDAQVKHMDVQLGALDKILTRVLAQNAHHHDAHVDSLGGLASTVKQSYSSIGDHYVSSSSNAQDFQKDLTAQITGLQERLEPLKDDVHAPLTDLRNDIMASNITDYLPTGETPQKIQYHYQTTLPRTQPHETLLQNFREPSSKVESIDMQIETSASPTKTIIFTDEDTRDFAPSFSSPILNKKIARPESSHSSLRELDVNVGTNTAKADPLSVASEEPKAPKTKEQNQPPQKRLHTGHGTIPEIAAKDFSSSLSKLSKRPMAEGRENMPPLAASVGSGGSRSLRSRGP